MTQREKEHQQRIVSNNSNSTYSNIILPAFKDIWDFQQKYNTTTATNALKNVSHTIQNCNVDSVLDCYDTNGDKRETAIVVYTMQSFVYQQMNQALREDTKQILNLFAPYIYQLVDGINHVNNYHGTVFRGILLPNHLIAKYTKDTVFFWPGFTSCSQEKSVALHWPDSNCIFQIQIPKRFAYSCSNIDDLSVYKSEKEVLIQPYSCYRVLKNQYNPQMKKYIIKLVIEATCYNLSGVWINNDTQHKVNNAGIYFIAQYGKNVFWFGKKDKATWDFANVAHGVIETEASGDDDQKGNDLNPDILSIKWSDLPIAHDRFCGELKLKISSDYLIMNKIHDSNGIFWGDEWKKQSNIFLDNFELDVQNIKWQKRQKDTNINGVWRGNYGGIYIIATSRDKNVEQICWIAYDPDMRWAHVAFGVIDNKKEIKVTWGDLLIGLDRFSGTLQCVLHSNDKIIITESHPKGIFLTQSISKTN